MKRYVYASSCSVYGYTENELFDETRPVSSSYPYGISKLQGEQAVTQLSDREFLGHLAAQGHDFRLQSAHESGSDHQHDVQVGHEGPRDHGQ